MGRIPENCAQDAGSSRILSAMNKRRAQSHKISTIHTHRRRKRSPLGPQDCIGSTHSTFLVIHFSFCSSGHIRGLKDLPGQPATGFITGVEKTKSSTSSVYFHFFFALLLSPPHTHTHVHHTHMACLGYHFLLPTNHHLPHPRMHRINYISCFIRFGFACSTFSSTNAARGSGVLARCSSFF